MPDNIASICDIELALAAAQITYAIGRDDKIDMNQDKPPPVLQSWSDAERVIQQKGYSIYRAIAPKKGLEGTSDAPLSAVCLIPNNDTAPIVIGFKGTNPALVEDLKADLKLAWQGLPGQKYRDAAYAFYKKVREEYPGRKLVVSGHSLGGGLASYVGIKAYSVEQEENLLEIRTFNSAPIRTKYTTILKDPEQANIQRHFVNYRSQNDIFSKNTQSFTKDGIAKGYYGDMVTLSNSEPSRAKVHLLPALKGCMPPILLTQKIGGSVTTEDMQNLYQEKLLGHLEILRYKIKKCTDSDKLDAEVSALVTFLAQIEQQIQEAFKNHNPLLAQNLLFNATDKISQCISGYTLSDILFDPRLQLANMIADLGVGEKQMILNAREVWIEPTMMEHFCETIQTIQGMLKTYVKALVDKFSESKHAFQMMMNPCKEAQDEKNEIADVNVRDVDI